MASKRKAKAYKFVGGVNRYIRDPCLVSFSQVELTPGWFTNKSKELGTWMGLNLRSVETSTADTRSSKTVVYFAAKSKVTVETIPKSGIEKGLEKNRWFPLVKVPPKTGVYEIWNRLSFHIVPVGWSPW